MTVKYEEYIQDKQAFFNKHDNEFTIQTSSMDEYSRYHKEYIFDDGAIWYESYSPEWFTQTVEVDVKGVAIKTDVEVKLFRTEFWNTDNSSSKYYYEKY